MKYKKYKLGDIATFKTGKLNSNQADKNGKYPFFTTAPETYRINDYAFDQDAVLLGGNNANGVYQLKRYTGKFNAYQRTYVISVKDNKIINNDYLFYALSTKLRELQNGSLGTATKYITKIILNNIIIKVPENTKLMKKYSHNLRLIDEKIKLNQQINDNLNRLMSEIFKNEVIDFTNNTSQSLTDIANYKNGLAMQKFRPKKVENSLPVLKIRELNQGFTDSSSDRCTDTIDSSVVVNTGDIIFSWSGTLLVKLWSGNKSGLNQHLFKVTSNKYPNWFIYEWTKYYLQKFQEIAKDKATTMGHIKRSDLKSSRVNIPSANQMKKFNKIFIPLYQKRIELIEENQSLSALKQELLNKYF